MPYGIPDEKPNQTAWMERCVSGIKGTNKRTGKPYTEGDKIAICKAQLKKQGWKTSEGEIEVDLDSYYEEESTKEEKMERKGKHVRIKRGRITDGHKTIC